MSSICSGNPHNPFTPHLSQGDSDMESLSILEHEGQVWEIPMPSICSVNIQPLSQGTLSPSPSPQSHGRPGVICDWSQQVANPPHWVGRDPWRTGHRSPLR